MLSRCTCATDTNYRHYGGRGIRVCERWATSYEAFLSDMGPRPPGMTIERNDSNGDYEPANCRWATQKEQKRNTSRNVFLEFNGKRQAMSAWEEELGFARGLIRNRLKRGWSVARALSEPIHTDAKPTEAELLAADVARDERKGERWHEANDRRALDAQVLNADAMRRAGWIA